MESQGRMSVALSMIQWKLVCAIFCVILASSFFVTNAFSPKTYSSSSHYFTTKRRPLFWSSVSGQKTSDRRLSHLFSTDPETPDINNSLSNNNTTESVGENQVEMNDWIQLMKRISSPEKDKVKANNWLEIAVPRLLTVDIIGCLVSCELLGLADVMSDNQFWLDGGFAQPIPGVPITLGTLMQRDSVTSVAWILAALIKNGYSQSAVFSDDSSTLKCAATIWLDYCSIRIVLALLSSALLTHLPVDGLDLVRQCWFTACVLLTFRYIFSKYSR
jgi:hypothetical protein